MPRVKEEDGKVAPEDHERVNFLCKEHSETRYSHPGPAQGSTLTTAGVTQ